MRVRDAECVGVRVLEAVKLPVLEGDCVFEDVRVRLGVDVAVPERLRVPVCESVCDPVCVRVGVTVGDAVMEELGV